MKKVRLKLLGLFVHKIESLTKRPVYMHWMNLKLKNNLNQKIRHPMENSNNLPKTAAQMKAMTCV
jgi:hypothetical protein